MADSKVSALTSATSATSDDLLYLVDDPSGTSTSKKITVANFEASLDITNMAGTLGISQGGTGQTTSTAALNALLPTQTSNSGKVLQTDGTNSSWQTVSGGGGMADPGANGIMVRTALDTSTARTITGTSNEISVADGTGVSGNPTLSLPATIDLGGKTSFEIPNSATPTVDADGEIAVDTTVTDFSHGVLKYFGGEELGVVAMPIAEFTSPTDGYVVAYNATNDEFELVSAGGAVTTTGYKTTDQTTTSATAVDITSMSFSIGASEVWSVEFYLGCTVSGAAGIKYAVSVPSGATIGGSVRGTLAAPAIITASATLTTAQLQTTPSMTQISVLIQNSTTPGTVQAQYASADGIVSAVAKGGQCYFVARKLA